MIVVQSETEAVIPVPPLRPPAIGRALPPYAESRNLFKQCLGFLQVKGIEPFAEPIIALG